MNRELMVDRYFQVRCLTSRVMSQSNSDLKSLTSSIIT